MNELEFQEEWLSAYLDDELTDEQRLIVEQRLAIDPAAQAMLGDLQRVRSMVAKLPSWSGPDLKFPIPVGVPGSVDEADDDIESNSDEELEDDSELDDFEEVPRLIEGVEEPRVLTARNSNPGLTLRPNSGATRSLLGGLATAASILLAVGVGYLYWPSSAPQVAQLDSAPSVAAKAAPRLSEQDGKIESSGLENSGLASSTNDRESSNGAMEFGAPVVSAPAKAEGRDETKFERTDPAPMAKKAEPIPQSDTLALNAKAPSRDVSSDEKMKMDLESMPASPRPSPPGAAAGLGGARAAADLAMNNLPADAPAAAELPPPSQLKASSIDGAGAKNDASAASDMGNNAQRNALPAPAVYYARSQSWQDEETQTTLSLGAQQNRADQLAFGNNTLQRGAEQYRGAVASDSVLMAAIKPEVANSPQFFPNLVNSNRLVEVDQRPLLNQAFAFDHPQSANAAANSAATGRLESAGNTASPNDTANDKTNAPTSNMLSNQRFQMAIPNQPQGNSFILFLNRNEAKEILNQLQEKGQVSSQIWRVINQPESQEMLGRELNNTPAEPQNATGKRVTGEPQKENTESVSSEKVILILNGPPN